MLITSVPGLESIRQALVAVTKSDGNNGASLRSLSQNEREIVKEAGYSYVDRLSQLEEDLYAKGFHVKEGSPMSSMAKFKRPSKEVIDLSKKNVQFVETVRILKNEFLLNEEEMEQIIRSNEDFDSGCLPEPQCLEPDTYRTIDGSCNQRENLKNLGRAASGYRRFLSPAYDDGVSRPRKHSITGAELPSPRFISMNTFSNEDRPLEKVTSLLMQFGQFINHDMESTSQFSFLNGDGFACCAQNNTPLEPSVLQSLVHCMPITIPIDDPQLMNTDEKCMNFVRSSTGPNRIKCDLPFVSYAEQFNQNSHWLDASTVYGSSATKLTFLRNNSNGMLQTFDNFKGHVLLPMNLCSDKCSFNAGDSRLNEQPQLTVMHTIWMREHNRIAPILTALNPSWSKEKIFQETRRIVIAELQHITYNEFLPALLGKSGMKMNKNLWPLPGKNTFKVEPNSQGGMFVYNNNGTQKILLKTVNSGPVSNEFAAAAFRMGHSLVQGKVQLIHKNGTATFYDMKSVFNNPDLTSDLNFLDNTIRGLVNQPSQTVDNQIADDLQLHLFENSKTSNIPGYNGQDDFAVSKFPLGILDIIALNIQRGRDHGLPSYNSYREKCGLPKLNGSFQSLPTEKITSIDPEAPIIPYFDPWVVEGMELVYASVDDIDLFVGGLAEINPLDDGLLGPTFMCIIADNFLKLKYEDRYFYEAGKGTNPNPFTPNQLNEIKKSSMARILCDNNDGTVLEIQPNSFLVPTETNPVSSCKDSNKIPSLNLDHWKVCFCSKK